MGVLDKFLNVMKLNDDDDYDDGDFFDEEDEFFEEERPKKRLFKKMEEEDDDFFDDELVAERKTKQQRQQQSPAKQASNKVTPMRNPRKSNGNMEVCVIKPVSMEDTREITETLLSSRAVVLNLEGLDVEVAQRIIDFTSGSTYAINGNLQKISNYIFIVTPSTVDISGDFQHIIEGAFDVPSIQTGY